MQRTRIDRTMKKVFSIIGSFLIAAGAFAMYWIGFRDYSEPNLFLGAIASIIFGVTLYLPDHLKIERFSPAWGIGIILGIGLLVVGLVFSFTETPPTALNSWDQFMWFSGLWITLEFAGLPKEYKPYEWSFFKRVRPIEKESAHVDKAEA